MAITNGYATLEKAKLWANISSTDTDDDSVIEDIIEAASRYIDRKTGRTFYGRTETRYYDVPPNAGRTLYLDDDLLSIDTLTNGDGNTIASTEYNLVPKNSAPYYAIKLKASSSTYWDFDSDGNSEWVISVNGTWGYSSSTPDDIQEACLLIMNSMYRRRSGENASSVATITAAGVVITPQDVPSQAIDIINVYRRRT